MAIARPAHPAPVRTPSNRALPQLSPRAAWHGLGLTPAALVAPVSRQWAAVPLAVVALIFAGAALEPAPAAEATGAAAAVESVIAGAFVVGILASIFGAMSLQRWGLATSFGLALFTVGLLVSCPTSGHHTWGAWFAGESALILAATGLAGTALWKTNHR